MMGCINKLLSTWSKNYKLRMNNKLIGGGESLIVIFEYVFGVTLCMSKKVNLLSACRQGGKKRGT